MGFRVSGLGLIVGLGENMKLQIADELHGSAAPHPAKTSTCASNTGLGRLSNAKSLHAVVKIVDISEIPNTMRNIEIYLDWDPKKGHSLE